jgi:hypothetical protein
MPLTSTSVATNGAEALAGSAPNLRSTNGSIAPASVPQVVHPITLIATAIAINT